MDWLSQLANCQDYLAKASQLTYQHNPRELVNECGNTRLFHYLPITEWRAATPVLVVFATVNKADVLDLIPQKSFIRGLLAQGLDVYLLDWGQPQQQDKTRFADYVNRYLTNHIAFIKQDARQAHINLTGICQGGLISVCYAATHQDVKNLVLISTPIDFHCKENAIANVLSRVDWSHPAMQYGNVPGDWLTQFFISLRPFELVGKKYLHMMEKVDDPVWMDKFMRMEKWLYDSPDQPAAAFSEFVRGCYQRNQLIKGEFKLDDQFVALADIQVPTLNIAAREDVIIPPASTQALRKYIGSEDYQYKTFPSGHIGVYVSERVGNKMARAISNWLIKRD